MELFGVLTGKAGVPNDRLEMNFGQATGLSHTVPFGDMFVDGDDGVVGQSGVEKDGAPAFGKSLFQWVQYSKRVSFAPYLVRTRICSAPRMPPYFGHFLF